MSISDFLRTVARRLPVISDFLKDRDQLRHSINMLTLKDNLSTEALHSNQAKVIGSLSKPLPLPPGVTEKTLFDFVTSVRVSDAPEEEMRNYGSHDFRRFVYTLGLTEGLFGECLELGANPYFTTVLMHEFSELNMTLANYFGGNSTIDQEQTIIYNSIKDQERRSRVFRYSHFNVEQDIFPFSDNSFDAVIFAEIIEHLLMDPCSVIRQIKRVLKPGGSLILTTPNVARLENVSKLISGANIYDPYSGYGPYGRHNREYNVHELVALLEYEGFSISNCFTSDVHHNSASQYASQELIAQQVVHRNNDLGQYIFLKAINSDRAAVKRPSWLYRSMPADQLESLSL